MTRSVLVALGLMASVGCVGTIEGGDELGANAPELSWEEFRDSTYREPWAGGVYIVDGDTPIDGEKNLREFYDAHFGKNARLIVNRIGNSDEVWSASQKLNLSYCVSNAFGNKKSQVINALAAATGAWQAAANVKYVYKPEQDPSCTVSNTSVVFDVRPVSGGAYLARAFYPKSGRASRSLLIDNMAFGNLGQWTLTGVLRHEIGHTLGFRHEHTRPQAGAGACFEDNGWRAVTAYDRDSVMHYPQCNGNAASLLELTTLDRQGAASVYGAPASGPNP